MTPKAKKEADLGRRNKNLLPAVVVVCVFVCDVLLSLAVATQHAPAALDHVEQFGKCVKESRESIN